MKEIKSNGIRSLPSLIKRQSMGAKAGGVKAWPGGVKTNSKKSTGRGLESPRALPGFASQIVDTWGDSARAILAAWNECQEKNEGGGRRPDF